MIMDEILGTPPPPPPPGVQELEQVKLEGTLRQKMEQHPARTPVALFVMRAWTRSVSRSKTSMRWARGAIATKTTRLTPRALYPAAKPLTDPPNCGQCCAEKPDLFARSLGRKMLTYALGRGLETYDAQAVNEIAARVKDNDYKFSSLILAVVESQPFQMRRARGVE